MSPKLKFSAMKKNGNVPVTDSKLNILKNYSFTKEQVQELGVSKIFSTMKKNGKKLLTISKLEELKTKTNK